MQLHCENCQKGVNTPGEMDGCRCCSKPPPPPSKTAKPGYQMPAEDHLHTIEEVRARSAEYDEFNRFKRESRRNIPPLNNIGDRLRERAGLPPAPRPAPAPPRLRDTFYDEHVEEDHPLFV